MTNVSFCLLVLTYILSACHFKSKKVFVAVDRDLVVTIESYESAEGGRLLNYFERELDSILKQGTASFANGFANFTFSSHHDHFSRLLGVNINRPDRERSDGRGIGYPIEQDGLQNLLSRKVYSQVTEQKLLSVKYSLIENEDHWTVIKSSQVSPAVDVFVCKKQSTSARNVWLSGEPEILRSVTIGAAKWSLSAIESKGRLYICQRAANRMIFSVIALDPIKVVFVSTWQLDPSVSSLVNHAMPNWERADLK